MLWFVYGLGHPLSGSYYLFFLADKKKSLGCVEQEDFVSET